MSEEEIEILKEEVCALIDAWGGKDALLTIFMATGQKGLTVEPEKYELQKV